MSLRTTAGSVRGAVRWLLGLDRAARERRRVEAAVAEWSAYRVLAGPFNGMKYVERSLGSMLSPKLLGTYELELHDWIERVVSTRYRVIHDIGCAEGYYAVGLCIRDPHLRVFAYDLDPDAPALLKRLAEINGVANRVRFCGQFGESALAASPERPALVFCDIEGREAELLDPKAFPELRTVDILVEVHDGPRSTRTIDELRRRFEVTHSLETVFFTGRSATHATADARRQFRPADLKHATDERRRLGLAWCLLTQREAMHTA